MEIRLHVLNGTGAMFNVRLFNLACLASVVLPLAGVVAVGALAWTHQRVDALELGVCAAMFLLTLIGIEVGYHRHFAHGSFHARPAVRYFFGALGSMACQGSVMWWTGVHRTHHQFADHEGDPHSPMNGFLRAHLTWLFDDEVNPRRWPRRIKDLIRDPVAIAIHRHYPIYALLGFVLPAIVVGSLRGTWMGALSGFLWGGLVRLFLVNQIVFSINSICHTFGTRPYGTRDHSRNNYWLMLPSLGFSLHNNHHAFPSSPTTSHAWWQVDLCGWVIRALASCRLATDLSLPSSEQLARRKQDETCEGDDSHPVAPRHSLRPCDIATVTVPPTTITQR